MSSKEVIEAYQSLLDNARMLEEDREWVASCALTPLFPVHYDPTDRRAEVCVNAGCGANHSYKVIVSGHYADDENQTFTTIRAPRMLSDLMPGTRPGPVWGSYVRRGKGLATSYERAGE